MKEQVQRRTESPLIKCHKEHHISFHRHGEHGVIWHTARRELCRRHKPLFYKLLQVTLHNHGRGPVLFCHGLRMKEKQNSLNPSIPLFFFFLFSFFLFTSLFIFRRREGGKEGMAECARGCKGA
jgi:hypothetical protein